MMGNPVDLANLREMTDGDAEFEQQMIAAFFESAQQCLDKLTMALKSDDHMKWREASHALKGVAYNLGAGHLAELCKLAQDDFEASVDEKTDGLKDIRRAYDEVCQYLSK